MKQSALRKDDVGCFEVSITETTKWLEGRVYVTACIVGEHTSSHSAMVSLVDKSETQTLLKIPYEIGKKHESCVFSVYAEYDNKDVGTQFVSPEGVFPAASRGSVMINSVNTPGSV